MLPMQDLASYVSQRQREAAGSINLNTAFFSRVQRFAERCQKKIETIRELYDDEFMNLLIKYHPDGGEVGLRDQSDLAEKQRQRVKIEISQFMAYMGASSSTELFPLMDQESRNEFFQWGGNEERQREWAALKNRITLYCSMPFRQGFVTRENALADQDMQTYWEKFVALIEDNIMTSIISMYQSIYQGRMPVVDALPLPERSVATENEDRQLVERRLEWLLHEDRAYFTRMMRERRVTIRVEGNLGDRVAYFKQRLSEKGILCRDQQAELAAVAYERQRVRVFYSGASPIEAEGHKNCVFSRI